MKIFGIGTDIVNIKRMEKSIKKNGVVFKNGNTLTYYLDNNAPSSIDPFFEQLEEERLLVKLLNKNKLQKIIGIREDLGTESYLQTLKKIIEDVNTFLFRPINKPSIKVVIITSNLPFPWPKKDPT